MSKVENSPLIAQAVNGIVLVDGLPGVLVSMTPEAAAESSDRLLAAASLAQGQVITAREAARAKSTEEKGD